MIPLPSREAGTTKTQIRRYEFSFIPTRHFFQFHPQHIVINFHDSLTLLLSEKLLFYIKNKINNYFERLNLRKNTSG